MAALNRISFVYVEAKVVRLVPNNSSSYTVRHKIRPIMTDFKLKGFRTSKCKLQKVQKSYCNALETFEDKKANR